MLCDHCSYGAPKQKSGIPINSNCCWARAMQIKKFKQRVKQKFIIQVLFDLIISVMSVVTDIISILLFFAKENYTIGILTLIPVLLPTFVFTNVYLSNENNTVKRKIPTKSQPKRRKAQRETSRKKSEEEEDNGSINSTSSNTDSSIRNLDVKYKVFVCQQKCRFHWGCFRNIVDFWNNCCRGCWQCLGNRDLQLRRRGAHAVKKSFQRMFKYGLGTFVLRFIAWAWYIKALIFGVKAYREPKRFMKIETPDNHWSHGLLVRLDFLQAALENAPQCVIQLFALITLTDDNLLLGSLTLGFSFVDFIRVSLSVHWDMHKGPVIAPGGCYDTFTWKFINTSSWILIYSSRSAAIALIFATSLNHESIWYIAIPSVIFTIHILLFGKLLSKAEYGVAAQKVFVAVFISVFFLPELDSSVVPAIIQFYYATMIIENALFILPWAGFDKEYCVAIRSPSYSVPGSNRPPPPPPVPSLHPMTGISDMSLMTELYRIESTTHFEEFSECPYDPIILSLAIPILTITGVAFRVLASNKMVKYKKAKPRDDTEQSRSQNKLESSIANLFSKKWSRMTMQETLAAFFRMLKKEVIIPDPPKADESMATNININVISMDNLGGNMEGGFPKRFSFLAAKVHEELLASQEILQKTFLTRTTRSHDIHFSNSPDTDNDGSTENLEYNSDTDIVTFKNHNVKKRPRIPRSRNVSENNVDPPEAEFTPEINTIQVDFPSLGKHFLETCWV